MYRIAYDLGKINETLGVSLAVIYRDDLDKKKVSKLTYNGSIYLNFKLYPYFVLKFYTPGEEYNRNTTQTLNRFDTFHFIMLAKEFGMKFMNRKDLFSYDENSRLVLNKTVGDEISKTVCLKDGKKILIKPIVVPERDSNQEYEGVVLFSNSYETYALLTFDEFRFLVYLLEQTNVDELAISMVKYADEAKEENMEVVTKSQSFHQIETKRPSDFENVSFRPLINNKTMPEI